MNINKIFFKFLIYYPVTILRLEFPFFLIRKLKKSQYLDPSKIEAMQSKKLNKLLRHAKTNTVHYKNIDAENTNLQALATIPILEKESVRSDYKKLISNKFHGLKVNKTTSGSTGAPVSILKNNYGMAQELAATWRGYSWAGIDVGDKQARFWGVPIERKGKLKAQLIDFVTNRYRISAFSFSDSDLETHTNNLEKFSPKYFYGYVSMIVEYCHFINKNDYQNKFKLTAIITTSEVLTDTDRELLSNTFNCPVFNEYGCGEIGTIAHECKNGALHISAENMIIEIVDAKNNPVKKGVPGEIIVTDLTNYSMPLIRYRMRDFATISSNVCNCGINLPCLEKIHGRSYDMIENSKGKKFHGEFFLYIIENIKKKGIAVDGYQIEQSAKNQITIRLICTQEAFVESKNTLEIEILEKFDNDVDLVFMKCESIEREPSGKLKVIKCLSNKSS